MTRQSTEPMKCSRCGREARCENLTDFITNISAGWSIRLNHKHRITCPEHSGRGRKRICTPTKN